MSSADLIPLLLNAQAWDTVTVAGVQSPGYCTLSEFSKRSEFDIKKGKGVFGATITYVGRPPAKGSITFYLWTPSHFIDWATFRTLFNYDPTKSEVKPVDIYHPSLDDVGLKSFVAENVEAIKHEGKGLYSCKIDLIEYFPPPKKSAVSTPTSSKTGADKSAGGAGSGAAPGTIPDPAEAARQAEIARLTEEAKKP
jgi:hypothetical protein